MDKTLVAIPNSKDENLLNFPSDLILDCSKAYKIYKPKNTFELLNKEYKKLGTL